MPKSTPANTGKTRAEQLISVARTHGARIGKSTDRVNIASVERAKLSWLGKCVQAKMGVPAKRTKGHCPVCGRMATVFELDHMGPWRNYVAAFAGPHVDANGNMPRAIARILYNDPENLWWICKSCNRKKCDYVSERGEVAMSGVRGRNVDPGILYR